MIDSGIRDEEQLGRLIGLLEPAPEGWVRAAQEIPAFRQMLDEIVERAEADQAFRDALVTDLEAAVAAAGYRPEPRMLGEVRRRIGRGEGAGA
jgi:hypothetical protein